MYMSKIRNKKPKSLKNAQNGKIEIAESIYIN
jgi:hypothetical protein